MSGIIGYVGLRARALEGRLRSARDAMAHRGPDGAGHWTDDHATLGAHRLSVLDLSPGGRMPMASADGGHVLVFDGAIYNYLELRAELAHEVPFRSSGDAEVILQAFRVWGWDRLLDRLDGMFAFALWDARERTLYAARDRMGEKPFFLGRHDDGLSFASTLAALMQLRGGPPIVDVRALDAYLTYQAVPAPLAMFEGTAQLPPAHELRFSPDTGELRVSRYWELRFAPKRQVGEREALDTLDALVRHSVAQRLRGDVSTGTLLSAGVDSSLVTAIASQESGRTLDAVTMGFHERQLDERPFARAVAARHGVTLHEEMFTPRVATDLPAIVWHYGQPVANVSIVPSYYMAKAARRFMTVALVGDGANEALGGYARPMIERAAGIYRALFPSPMRRALGAMLGERPGTRSEGLRRRLAMLANAGARSAADAFVCDRAFRRLRDESYDPRFLAALDGWHPDALYRDAWSHAVAADDVDRAMYGDIATCLPDQILATADVSAMAHSLETRSPFLGREVLEYAATLPTSLRLKGWTTNYLLERVADRYVPREALQRRKCSVVMPMSHWLGGDLAPFAHATLGSVRFLDRGWLSADAVRRLLAEHASGARDWGQQLWTLTILEIWARLALDGSLAPSDQLDVHVLAESAR